MAVVHYTSPNTPRGKAGRGTEIILKVQDSLTVLLLRRKKDPQWGGGKG